MQEVIVIESNSAGNGAAALKAAKEMGYVAHFLTSDPREYVNARKNPIDCADIVTTIATKDITKLLHFVTGRNIASVLAFTDYEVVQAAIVGEYLGLNTPPLAGILNCRFKDLFRKASAGTGWTPRFATMTSADSVTSSPIGYPCIVKPVDESGSVGVKKCNNDFEFVTAVNEICAVSVNYFGYIRANRILVEEFIPGSEFSAEMAWHPDEQRFVLLGVTRKEVTPPPYSIEVGHSFPFLDANNPLIEKQIGTILQKVGLKNIVCHVEFKLRPEGVGIIEVNPRIGGDNILDLVEYCTGIDMAKLQLEITLGKFDSVQNQVSKKRHGAIRFFLPHKAGIVESIIINKTPEVINVFTVKLPCEARQSAMSNDDRLGAVIVSGISQASAMQQATFLVDQAVFTYQQADRLV